MTSNTRSTIQYVDGKFGFRRVDTYINSAKWEMQAAYNAAKYKCMRLNRDMDGNGRIDENEVQWYLASINQLTDLWIGETPLTLKPDCINGAHGRKACNGMRAVRYLTKMKKVYCGIKLTGIIQTYYGLPRGLPSEN